MELYTYYRSTSSYRVRIALALKGLAYQSVPVNLLQGEQRGSGYVAVNPQGRVPALRTDGGELLVQSPAIIEYLEEVYPQPALLPSAAEARAKVRGVAAIIGCDIHPLHNVSVLNRLRQAGQDESQVNQWIGHWISQGLAAVEQLIGDHGFCFGDEPGLADVYLIPQLYAAERFNIDLDSFPRILRVAALAAEHAAFAQAHPPCSRTARLSEWNGSPPEACRYVRKASGAGPGPLSAITHAPDQSARPAGNPDAGIAKRESHSR
ncbi:Stringent starvation protein A [Pseudomonas putida]|nr:Stringent starvation protein A [Pseudomonas putida]